MRNVLIAVFISGFTMSLKAGAVQVNFDGNRPAIQDVRDIVRAVEVSSANIIPSQAAYRDLRENPVFEEALNNSIAEVIIQAKFMREDSLVRHLEMLLSKGTIKQKQEFVHWREGVYRFPGNTISKSEELDSTTGDWCRKVTKVVCEWITDFFDGKEVLRKECHTIIVDSCWD